MQFLSKLFGLCGVKKSRDLPPGERIIEESGYEPVTHRGESVLAELQWIREDARTHAKEVLARMDWFRAQLKHWDFDGLPPVRQEAYDLVDDARHSVEDADNAKKAAQSARSAAGLPSDPKDVCTDATVYDADHDLQIMGILGVNAKAGWVLVADLPVQLTEHGHIKSRRLRFSSIIEFKPNDQGSGSFHCYGRLPDGKEQGNG